MVSPRLLVLDQVHRPALTNFAAHMTDQVRSLRGHLSEGCVTPDRFKPLLDREFLKAELHYEYEDYCAADADASLRARLTEWSAREVKRETQAEAAWHGGTIISWRPVPGDKGRAVFTYLVEGFFRVKCPGRWGQERAIVRRA